MKEYIIVTFIKKEICKWKNFKEVESFAKRNKFRFIKTKNGIMIYSDKDEIAIYEKGLSNERS